MSRRRNPIAVKRRTRQVRHPFPEVQRSSFLLEALAQDSMVIASSVAQMICWNFSRIYFRSEHAVISVSHTAILFRHPRQHAKSTGIQELLCLAPRFPCYICRSRFCNYQGPTGGGGTGSVALQPGGACSSMHAFHAIDCRQHHQDS